MWYFETAIIVFAVILLLWAVAGVYAIVVYLGSFIDDTRTNVNDLVIFKLFGEETAKDIGIDNGEDLFHAFGMVLFLILIGSFIWVITIPAIIVMIIVLYLRGLKRKEKEGN